MKRQTLAAALTLFLLAGPASAEGESPVAETITFVVSTGSWPQAWKNAGLICSPMMARKNRSRQRKK